MNSRNVAGAVAKAIDKVGMFRSSALKEIADNSVHSYGKNCGFLTQMPAVKQKSYLDHLRFLDPGADNYRVTDIARISNQNLVNFVNIVAKVPLLTGWQGDDESALLKRVNDLQFIFSHGSVSSELVLDSGSIYSRSMISKEISLVPGLMKKSGDKEYRYNDFVFFHLSAISAGREVADDLRDF